MKILRKILCLLGWHDYDWHSPYISEDGVSRVSHMCGKCGKIKITPPFNSNTIEKGGKR